MNILLVDDHAIVRSGLKRLLAMVSAADIAEASSGREALAAARTQAYDLIVLDLNLPDLGGVELIFRLRQISSTPILILTMHAEPLYVTRSLDAGAQGYVSKNASPEEVLTAIKRVASGGRYIEHEIAQGLVLQPLRPVDSLAQLAPRELEIVRHLAAGRSLGEIAAALGIGYKTVANNCSIIKSKLGVTRTADLLRLAVEAGMSRAGPGLDGGQSRKAAISSRRPIR
jgi:DNA-binding NarL/FixJ family response regulator